MSKNKCRVAILASGDRASGSGGSTADRVTRESLEGKVSFHVAVVICDNPVGTVGVYERFKKINSDYGLKGGSAIDVVTIGPSTHPGRPQERGQTLDESSAVCRELERRNIDFAAMLGFKRIITGEFVETWGWHPKYADDAAFGYRNGLYHPKARISNNHPSILPFTADTHGPYSHKLAIDLYTAGKIQHTAMTWHLASADIDNGPIIDEIPVLITPADDADSLGDKVQAVEKEFTSRVLEKHLILRAEHQLANS